MAKRFYDREKDFERFRFQLKQTPCPHCRATGHLNLHGYLRGYDESNYGKKIIRGRRIFCSNRGRRKGCGRTFSVLVCGVLKRFTIGANTLWRFLKNIAAGLNKQAAFKKASSQFSSTTCYRIAKTFRYAQVKIRSKLSRLCPVPRSISNNPLTQTVRHLRAAFKYRGCPVSSFQELFQASFL